MIDDLLDDFDTWCKCSEAGCHNAWNYSQAKAKLLEALESCKPEEKKGLPSKDGWSMARVESFNAAAQQYHSNIRKLFDGETS